MHFGYSLYADHKEEHVIVKKENSNRTYYDEVNSDIVLGVRDDQARRFSKCVKR